MSKMAGLLAASGEGSDAGLYVVCTLHAPIRGYNRTRLTAPASVAIKHCPSSRRQTFDFVRLSFNCRPAIKHPFVSIAYLGRPAGRARMLEWTFDADFLGIARRDIETNRDEVLVGGDACLLE
jgi:hypothetical protein